MALKPRMKKAIEEMIKDPTATYKKIAERVGCSEVSVKRWMSQNEEFREALDDALDKQWRAARKIAQQKLLEKVEAGNLRAVEYLLNSLGMQAPQPIELVTNQITVTIDDDKSPIQSDTKGEK